MLRTIREKIREENGYTLVMMALSFSVLLAFMGLAVDAGLMFQSKRKMQSAADAAATAATLDYLYNGSVTSAKAAGQTAATANGYTNCSDCDAGVGTHVTINNPPVYGPNAGSPNYFEVIVKQPVPTLFMRAAGTLFAPNNGVNNMTVGARGTAGLPTNGNVCIWLMNATGADLNVQGAYDIEAPGCGVYMNSTSAGAVNVTGNGGTLNALFADAVGGSIGFQTSPTAITTYAAPRKSPWGNLNGGNPSTNAGCTTTVTTSNLTLSGTQTGPGAGNTICYTKAVTLSNATFGTGTLSTTSASLDTISSPAGTLVFGAGVTISGTVTIYGGTIDVYSGTFSQGNATLNIVAPTSGTYNGIAIMQPLSNTNQLQVQFGSGNQVLDGYIYAPGAQVYLQDHGGGITATGIVADNMYDKSSTIHIASYDTAHVSTTPNRVVTLVE